MLSGSQEHWVGEPIAGVAAQPWRMGRVALPALRLRVSERKLFLLIADLILINSALLLAVLMHGDGAPGSDWLTFKWMFSLSVIWVTSAVYFDVYNLYNAAHPMVSANRIANAALVATLLYTFTPWLTPPLGARSQTFLFVGISCLSLACWRSFYARVFVQPWFSPLALVVGAGAAGRELAAGIGEWARTPDAQYTSYRLAGYIDSNPAYWGTEISDVPVWGGHELLLSLVERLHVDEVVLAVTHRHALADDLLDALVRVSERGVRVTPMAQVYERLFGRVPVRHVGHDLPHVLDRGDSVSERAYAGLRRLADIGFAVVGLVVLAWIMPLLWVANALFAPGPLFYRQVRVGRGGRTFSIVKFRTMAPDAERHTGPVWAGADDPRITPIGRWLRRTRLDELPQVWNLLMGEMSLIGPRPERPEFVAGLAHSIPFYRTRHAVRPGLTGWAQVEYRYGNSVEDARIKLEYDLYYIKHQGLLLDLQILVKTLAVVLTFQGM